jgi:hypothetical protein
MSRIAQKCVSDIGVPHRCWTCRAFCWGTRLGARHSTRGENWPAHCRSAARALDSSARERGRWVTPGKTSSSARVVPCLDAEGVGAAVEGADPLAGRVAVEDDDGRVFELGAQAEHGLGGKFADVEAGVEDAHLRPDFVGGMGRVSDWTADDHEVRLFQRMLWSLCGGLRRSKSTTFVAGAKRSRAISTRCSAPVKTVVASGIDRAGLAMED